MPDFLPLWQPGEDAAPVALDQPLDWRLGVWRQGEACRAVVARCEGLLQPRLPGL